MENEHLKFVLDPETTQFSVTEKASGKVWYSNPQDLSGETIANKATKSALQSTLMIKYGTMNGFSLSPPAPSPQPVTPVNAAADIADAGHGTGISAAVPMFVVGAEPESGWHQY